MKRDLIYIIVIVILCVKLTVRDTSNMGTYEIKINAGVSGATCELLRNTKTKVVEEVVVVEESKVETVKNTYVDVENVEEQEEKDISCYKAYSAELFKKLGIVTYGDYTYTWYSEKVLPGGGLDIPGRHVNELGFVCDEDGYICVASDDLSKGTVVETPIGILGKIYDCGSGKCNLDLYVSW